MSMPPSTHSRALLVAGVLVLVLPALAGVSWVISRCKLVPQLVHVLICKQHSGLLTQ